MSRSAIAVGSACLLWGVALARANTLDAPAVVVANKTGAFSYEAVFTVKDPVVIAAYAVYGFPENNIVDASFIADCFCPPSHPGCPHDPGEELVIPVDGSLLNSSENGAVTVTVSLCGGGSFHVTTTVVPWVRIETVPVGNPGNPGELSGAGAGGHGPDRICGAVDYVYNIGKFEVTAGQYTEFLNAVAAQDTYGLYDTSMWSHSRGCKIERTGSSPNYSYSVGAEWAGRPVNYVSWDDAARFANWLHNLQPTGAQDLTTTEGGSYYLNGATNDAELLAVMREPDATWAIPTEDEWYKAAYHSNDGVTGNYYEYPTSSNGVPSNDLGEPTDPGNNATFWISGGSYTIGAPYYRTKVGAHQNSESPYGTFDQGGNVREWYEAVIGSYLCLRGGSFYTDVRGLHATFHYDVNPTYERHDLGFRVVEVSEPDCIHDGDGDGDVDLYDFALYQGTFADARCYALFHVAFNGPR